jgi:ABC-2 type transport system permease protein
MIAICIKEIRQFFSNLTGYIAVFLFLLVTGIFLFLLQDSSILEYGYASLEQFFELAPWVLMFLVPAVAMRSFSEEFRGGTFETLKTRPVTSLQIILGKYLSILVVLLMVIIPTFIYVYTIKSLSATGQIDGGGITGSYIGLFFLASVFAAISLFCSSLTANPVVAFLVSVFACLVLYYGFNSISLLPVFSGNADYYIEMLGIDFHYRSISRGVLDTRDIVYFLSVIALFIIITVKNIRKR